MITDSIQLQFLDQSCRKVIGIYYNNADTINAALERNPILRTIVRGMLEVIAPMVGREEE